MRKTVKLVSVLLLVAMISMTLTTMVSAKSGIDAANIAGNLHGTTSGAQSDVVNIGNQLIGIITTVGVVVAVIVLLISVTANDLVTFVQSGTFPSIFIVKSFVVNCVDVLAL